jgi:hypothetical protein
MGGYSLVIFFFRKRNIMRLNYEHQAIIQAMRDGSGLAALK